MQMSVKVPPMSTATRRLGKIALRRGSSSAQRHGHRSHRRAGGAPQLDAGAEEGEFVELVSGQLVELGHLKERHSGFGEQICMHREEIEPRGRWRLLKGEVVGPDYDGAVLGEIFGALTVEAGGISHKANVRPEIHLPGADQHDVADM